MQTIEWTNFSEPNTAFLYQYLLTCLIQYLIRHIIAGAKYVWFDARALRVEDIIYKVLFEKRNTGNIENCVIKYEIFSNFIKHFHS